MNISTWHLQLKEGHQASIAPPWGLCQWPTAKHLTTTEQDLPLSAPESWAMKDFGEKKNWGLRPCIDYGILNGFTISLRLVPSALEQLTEAHIFSKPALKSGYKIICICERDEWTLAYLITGGHYEYLVMPNALIKAPTVFQIFVNEIMHDFLHQCVID